MTLNGVVVPLPYSVRVLIMIASIATMTAGFDAGATEPAPPAGHITIARDVPVHNAFRTGEPGLPTNVATAREDIVIAGTKLRDRVPQSLPDSALENIGSTVPKNLRAFVPENTATAIVFSGAGPAVRGVGFVMGQATSSIQSGVAQSMSGGATRTLAPIGNVLSSMPGIR